MKNRAISIIAVILLMFVQTARADEGMWIPLLLKKYNIEEMQKLGFKLTAEDIYSINQNSLKDAIMIFGGGCTGEVISDQGLLITNHHCGYGSIQKHSTLEHDYLTDGFWAMTQKDELPNPGLEVRFLTSMEDVTEIVLNGTSENMTERERKNVINENIKKLKKEKSEGNELEIVIKPFFHGNQYFIFFNKVYKDIRLVGAPPSAIGKFGGDTDNWMWPRHTGDFSLFRIYCSPDGSPAEYSELNVPLKPKKHLPISLRGIEKGDFTMVFGYPGSTEEYVPSYEVDLTMNTKNPIRISFRDKILEIMKASMESDPLIRIQYSSKAAGVANGWKKWIGENRGLKKLNAIEKKREEEKSFTEWAKSSKYKNLLTEYEETYTSLQPYEQVMTAIYESLNGIEIIKMASGSKTLIQYANNDAPEERIETAKQSLLSTSKTFFKDYDKETSKAISIALTKFYMQEINPEYWPEYMTNLNKKGVEKGINKLYDKSILANEDMIMDYLNNFKGKVKKLENDPTYIIYSDFIDLYLNEISPVYNTYHAKIDSLNRVYMKAQMEFHKDSIFYPDANFTLRVGYGQVDNYKPADGVMYKHFTTLDGIIAKDNPEIYDYDVPDKLKELYQNKDFGQYADSDGTVHVCFTASNHTTGGNSGSPVIDAEGNLIGVNFDRNWEGTMSDLMYDPEMCRNISLDIRYALFIIDKFAGAHHLIKEMTLIK